MSESNTEHRWPPDQKAVLLYADLQVGRTFPPMDFAITAEIVDGYVEAVGDRTAAFHDREAAAELGVDGVLAPLGLWGVWGRQAYLQNHRMPDGGILAAQDMVYHAPVRVGDVLRVQATVAEKFERRGRNYVTIESQARNADDELCGIVRVTAIWPR